MKPTFFTTVAVAMLLPGPALAEPATRTITVDTPNYSGERVITRDRETGTYSRDTNITRKEDGAVATRHWESQRTDTGRTMSGSQTRFNGDTRTYEGERMRHGNHSRTHGTTTGPNGETLDYRAQSRWNGNGYDRRQRLRNEDGQVVAGRNTHVRERGNTQVRRVVSGNRNGARRVTTTRRTVNRRSRRGR
ncbi:hypothetical protein HFP57_05155 [Parasphingopyxis algicola]|uniref:hypothetical protein n=1 Tax=Parasphingopyxis algicola TaxID=2026624 RepID=UPI0015A301BE|nr:hypothetical protein [Parasphingopyxis algicola]QLC24468.1 hypothetical protein HFP57_05155 [Parasphingopyxis algicola]